MPDRNSLILQYMITLLRWSRVPITAAFAITGSNLPRPLYALGMGVCLVLLALWAAQWLRNRSG